MPSKTAASEFMKVARTNGLVDNDLPCFQTSVVGRLPNRDIVIKTEFETETMN